MQWYSKYQEKQGGLWTVEKIFGFEIKLLFCVSILALLLVSFLFACLFFQLACDIFIRFSLTDQVQFQNKRHFFEFLPTSETYTDLR